MNTENKAQKKFFFIYKSRFGIIIEFILPVETESQPWSNNSPRGEEEPVLRACFPSIASKLWYTNKPKPHKRLAHLGICKTFIKYKIESPINGINMCLYIIH